jgi:hypothetical protein
LPISFQKKSCDHSKKTEESVGHLNKTECPQEWAFHFSKCPANSG